MSALRQKRTSRCRNNSPCRVRIARKADIRWSWFRDLTTKGARIAVDQLFQISERFYLINIRDGVAYDAHVVWNKGLDIGVKFDGVISLSTDNDLILRRLKKLWLAKAAR